MGKFFFEIAVQVVCKQFLIFLGQNVLQCFQCAGRDFQSGAAGIAFTAVTNTLVQINPFYLSLAADFATVQHQRKAGEKNRTQIKGDFNQLRIFLCFREQIKGIQKSESGLENPAVVVDTNHSNSGKQYLEQIRIAKEVLHSTRHNDDVRRLVKGLMIESYIEDGSQKADGGVYGRSITDPCLGWEKTERLILDIADLR